jgi:hypothetical protein
MKNSLGRLNEDEVEIIRMKSGTAAISRRQISRTYGGTCSRLCLTVFARMRSTKHKSWLIMS